MSERNKKTPWDEELEGQVLAEEQAKRNQANSDQLAAYDALASAQEPKPVSTPTDEDDSDISALLSEAQKPDAEPEQPTLDIEVDTHTFTDENAAVQHFEHAFAGTDEPAGLWAKLEDRFGAKELRIYIGTIVLILVVLIFSSWFNTSASGIKAAKQSADKHKATVQAGQDEVTGQETAETSE